MERLDRKEIDIRGSFVIKLRKEILENVSTSLKKIDQISNSKKFYNSKKIQIFAMTCFDCTCR